MADEETRAEKPARNHTEHAADEPDPNDKSLSSLTRDAKMGTEFEHKLGLMDAFRKYPKAVGWSVLVSSACVMEGYDTAFIGSLYAETAFQRAFGIPVAKGYQITAPWQTALSLSSSIGIIIGIFLNGYLWETIGMKRTMLVSYVAITGLTFILVFAKSLPVILVGQILCGIPWGIFNTTAPTYASEVCPVILRGYLTTFINLTWNIGHLISAGVLRGVEGMSSRWAYDIPFAIQWVWPVPLFIGILFCPESPWWLIRKDRMEDAAHSLQRLSNGDDVKERLAMMVHTHQRECNFEQAGSGSYMDCFRGVDLRRTEIAFLTWGIQIFSGLPMEGYNTYFFEQAGLSVNDSFDMTIGYYAIGFCGTVASWFLITWFGRRPIFVTGLLLMTILQFIIGFIALAPASNKGAHWAQSVMLVIWEFCYDISVGPLAFCIVSEVSSTRLRGRTIAIGRNSFYLWNIVFSVATPYMLNPTAGNWKGKSGFLFGGTCLASLIWSYYRLPELKGRTYEELDLLFAKRVPARKFKETEIDAYSEEELKEEIGEAV